MGIPKFGLVMKIALDEEAIQSPKTGEHVRAIRDHFCGPDSRDHFLNVTLTTMSALDTCPVGEHIKALIEHAEDGPIRYVKEVVI